MEKIIKIIRLGAVAFLGTAVVYLANEGELGVNLTTILSTASPLVLVIITYIFEALRYILPVVLVKTITSKVIGVVGQDSADYIKQLINNKTPQEIVSAFTELLERFSNLEETVSAIRQDQENVM